KKIIEFLEIHGFELISDKQTKMISHVKVLIDEVLSQEAEQSRRVKFSILLAESLNMNYDSISETFSASEGITLEHYIINKRIEKVKELLVYTDASLTEIAHQLGFSSVNHLSRQFKELIGLPPSLFKSIRLEKRNLAERIDS
ncbi:MAG TPA: AraC family transcriptional regulator, partial [Cytophagales bacterium]|nr:AraC family transcriptional regulator [Cytophagales bacterium]